MGYKVIYTFLFVLCFCFSKAQTGIGTTTPNASAKLEVASTTQGFLPPRIALTGTTDNTTIKNAAGTSITPAAGLLVYNTATAGNTDMWLVMDTSNSITWRISGIVGAGLNNNFISIERLL